MKNQRNQSSFRNDALKAVAQLNLYPPESKTVPMTACECEGVLVNLRCCVECNLPSHICEGGIAVRDGDRYSAIAPSGKFCKRVIVGPVPMDLKKGVTG